jgi:hypothetical protein
MHRVCRADCTCRPGHQEWAYIEGARPGTYGEEEHACYFLQVSRPANFRVLFWYDPEGVTTDESDASAPRYWYHASVPFGGGCSWMSYPEEDGEFLCCFEGRRIRVLEKLATMDQARARALSSRQGDAACSPAIQDLRLGAWAQPSLGGAACRRKRSP